MPPNVEVERRAAQRTYGALYSSRGRSNRLLGCQLLEHDVDVDVAMLCVPKSAMQRTSNVKAELPPKTHGAFVGGDDKVELHCAETEPHSLSLGMLTH